MDAGGNALRHNATKLIKAQYTEEGGFRQILVRLKPYELILRKGFQHVSLLSVTSEFVEQDVERNP